MLVPPLVVCVCLLTLLIFHCMPEFNSEEAGISMLFLFCGYNHYLLICYKYKYSGQIMSHDMLNEQKP
jgi:hypothetical protein